MTETEIKYWLGFDDPRPLRPELIEALGDMPVPVTDIAQVRIFLAYLAYRNNHGRELFA
jgi:hypothetical protein